MPAFAENDPLNVTLEFQTVPSGSPSSVVAMQLIRLLTDGELAPGSRLPPERALAERLGVGRSAVREAIAALEILGIVQVRAGSGTYLQGGTSDLLPATLSWGLMLAADRTRELLEVRSSLERTAATLAAERGNVRQLAKLEEYLEAQERNLDHPLEFIDADARFHLQIAAMAGNEVLADMLQSLRSLLRIWVERGVRTHDASAVAYREHKEIFEALRDRDSVRADAVMAAHMRTASTRIASAAGQEN